MKKRERAGACLWKYLGKNILSKKKKTSPGGNPETTEVRGVHTTVNVLSEQSMNLLKYQNYIHNDPEIEFSMLSECHCALLNSI